MRLADFDYALPDELIARFPPARRRDSRLLIADAPGQRLVDGEFRDLCEVLQPGDLLVFNDTRVIPARLHGRKSSGGRVEILVERVTGTKTAVAQLRSSKSSKAGTRIELPGDVSATVCGRDAEFFQLEFSAPLEEYLDRHGEVPLPPYLGREAQPGDDERYQTVYARHRGAVAAPTAGLHFDEELLADTLRNGVRHAFVTLHVGAGTFQSLRENSIAQNQLHSERVTVSEEACQAVQETRAHGGRVVAVGTTSVRALESASKDGTVAPFRGETRLFITPGYRFRSVDLLLTNFHLPQSSLLMLVAAFAGREFILDAYRHAVDRRYRFFSYGDAMFIVPQAHSANET